MPGSRLPADTSTLAELLRNRGFATGAAVSSFLLQARTGIGQGFSFFDDEMPSGPSEEIAATERSGIADDRRRRALDGDAGRPAILSVRAGARAGCRCGRHETDRLR